MVRQMLGLGNNRPTMQFQQLNQAYQTDPRRILGQTLMGQGASSEPVATPLQGLGRLSSALVGAYLQRKAGDDLLKREEAARSALLTSLPTNVSPIIRGAVNTAPDQLSQALLAASLQPKTTSKVVDYGDMAGVQNTITDPITGDTSTQISNIVQRRAAPTTFKTLTNTEAQNLGYDTSKGQKYQINTLGKVVEVGGGGININTGASKTAGDAIVEKITSLDEAATAAQKTLSRVDQMSALLDAGLETGFGQESILNLKRIGQLFNPDYEIGDIAGAEAFLGNANALIGPLVKQLGSNPTDKDLGFIVTASPTLGKSVEGNKLLLKGIKLSQAREIALSQAATAFLQQPENKDILDTGLQGLVKLQAHLRNVVETNPLFTEGGKLLIQEYIDLTGEQPETGSRSVFDELVDKGLIKGK